MSSIVEAYRVVKTKEDIASGMNHEDDDFVPRQGPDQGDFKPRSSVINKTEASPEDKAWTELVDSLGQRVKDSNPATKEITVYTGGASAIKVQVVGYADPDAVNAAKAQEDAVGDTLPPTDKIADQVDDVRQFNTDQYMKHSTFNPKKFG